MSSEPQAFAAAVIEAFVAAGLATDEEVGDAGGPSTTTMTKFRKVANGEMTMGPPRGDVLRRIDRAANWRPGSARALWVDGKTPEPSERAKRGVPPQPYSRPRPAGVEGYVDFLADRLTEVEERLDLIAAQLESLSAAPPSLRSVAKEGQIEDSGEFNT